MMINAQASPPVIFECFVRTDNIFLVDPIIAGFCLLKSFMEQSLHDSHHSFSSLRCNTFDESFSFLFPALFGLETTCVILPKLCRFFIAIANAYCGDAVDDVLEKLPKGLTGSFTNFFRKSGYLCAEKISDFSYAIRLFRERKYCSTFSLSDFIMCSLPRLHGETRFPVTGCP